MRIPGRRLVAWLAAALVTPLLFGCDLARGTATRADVVATTAPGSAAGGPYRPTAEDEQALRTLMLARAAAVREHDPHAFRAAVDPSQPKLVAAQMVQFHNLERLPVASLSYEVATTYLTPAQVPGRDPVVHPEVLEHLELTGTMRHPVSNRLDLTFVKRGDHWLIGAERAPGDRGSIEDPQDRPWYGVPIAVRHDGPLTVVVDATRRDQLSGLVDAVRAGVQRDAGILGVDADYHVLVDATSNGRVGDFPAGVKEQVGAVTIPLVTTNLDHEATHVGGVAVKINPDLVAQLFDDDRVLWHELTHYLLFYRGGGAPAWLSEGVAAWAEWQPTELSGLAVPDTLYDRVQLPPHELPTNGVFYGKPDVDYLIAQAAVQWLVDRAGIAKLLDLMKACDRLDQGVNHDDATTEKAIRKVYGISVRDVEDGAWAALATLHH